MGSKKYQFLKFLFNSGFGFFVDLIIFTTLFQLGLVPIFANVISSLVAICVIFLLVTRYVFSATHSWRKFPIFCCWYLGSTFLASLGIQYFATSTSINLIVIKIGISGISVLFNFIFTKYLLFRSTRNYSSGAQTS